MFQCGVSELKACNRDPAELIFPLTIEKKSSATQAMPVNKTRLLCQDHSMQQIPKVHGKSKQ